MDYEVFVYLIYVLVHARAYVTVPISIPPHTSSYTCSIVQYALPENIAEQKTINRETQGGKNRAMTNDQ